MQNNYLRLIIRSLVQYKGPWLAIVKLLMHSGRSVTSAYYFCKFMPTIFQVASSRAALEIDYDEVSENFTINLCVHLIIIKHEMKR